MAKPSKFVKELVHAKAKLITQRDALNEAIAAIPVIEAATSDLMGDPEPCAAERSARDAALVVRNTANAALAAAEAVHTAASNVAETAENSYQAAEQILADCESP